MILKRKNQYDEVNPLYWSTGEAGSLVNAIEKGTGVITDQGVAQAKAVKEPQRADSTQPPENGTNETRKARLTFEHKLQAIREGINNSLSDASIRQRVASYNVDEARLQEGATLLAQVEGIFFQQQNLSISYLEATRAVHSAQEIAEKSLQRFIGIARIAFSTNKELLGKLLTFKRKKQTFAEWLEAARLFYSNALSIPGVLDEFARYTVTQQDIEAGRQLVLEAESAKNRQSSIAAEAQVLTDQKVLSFKSLWAWWIEYRQIIRLALKAEPQLMEKVGIVVPNRV